MPGGLLALTVLAAIQAVPAMSAMVTIGAKSQSASAVQDTIVVFDPLEAVPPPSHPAAVIDQIDKRFVPRVNVIRTGTAVSFPNSDNIRHQVYSFSKPHPFNLKLYAGSPRMDIVFDKPGLIVLGCNIHDTMVAFVAVVDTPYFTKTTPAGTATIDLPAGRYRLRVWHPNQSVPMAPREIAVGDAPLSLPLTLELGSSDSPAAWPE